MAPSSRSRAASSPASRPLLLPLPLLLLLALVATTANLAAANQILEFSDGVCTARINSQGLATLVGTPAKCKGKKDAQGNFDNDFDVPEGGFPARPAGVAAAAPTLGVTPEGDTADPTGTYYTVSWTGVSEARSSDRIAVLIGRQSRRNPDWKLHPRSYFFVPEIAPDTWKAGSGSVRIYLPLLRETVTVSYVRRDTNVLTNLNGNLWRNFKSLAQAYIEPPTADPPHNVRLSIVPTTAGAPIKAAAIWQQRNAITGATVKWRLESGAYGGAGSGTDAASVSTYTRSQMCQEPAKKAGFISPNQIYRGDLTGLAPNTRYYYQVGSDAAGWSAEKSFLTPPAADDPSATMRMLITADSGMYSPDNSRVPNGNVFAAQLIVGGWAMTPGKPEYTVVQAIAQQAGLGPGQQPGSRLVVDAMEKALKEKETHLVLDVGDLAYSRGEFHQWDLWGAQFGNQIAANAISAYTPGNHEADGPGAPDSPFNKTTNIDSGGECTVPTRRLLQMAQPSGATSDWYRVESGPVHFIFVNSEQNLGAKSKQRAWLEADLKSVDRQKTPWVVVSMHRPLLVDSNDGGDQKSATTIRTAIEPLLAKYEVDLVLVGHIHSAQRTCVGVLKGTCVGVNPDGTAKGPTHVVLGNGGYQSPLNAFQQVPAWEAWATWSYGFSEALVSRTSFTVNAYDTNGALLDTVTLTKPVGWVPNPAKAEALYAATASWVVPETVDLAGLTAALSVNFVAAALLNDDWSDKYLQPGTEFWSILNGLPGKDGNDFTINQIWAITAPVYELINTGVFGWLSPLLTQDVKYIWNLIKPGGRMYYGP